MYYRIITMQMCLSPGCNKSLMWAVWHIGAEQGATIVRVHYHCVACGFDRPLEEVPANQWPDAGGN